MRETPCALMLMRKNDFCMRNRLIDIIIPTSYVSTFADVVNQIYSYGRRSSKETIK